MKKLFLLFLTTPFLIMAQAPLEKGKFQLNAGLGNSGWGIPIYFGADYGIGNQITIGAEGSYRSYSSYGYKSSIVGLQANANYHFNELLKIPNQWDVYAGASANYYSWHYDNDYADRYFDSSNFGIGIQVGGRYFFTPKFGINVELGGGNATSGGKAGITYKL